MVQAHRGWVSELDRRYQEAQDRLQRAQQPRAAPAVGGAAGMRAVAEAEAEAQAAMQAAAQVHCCKCFLCVQDLVVVAVLGSEGCCGNACGGGGRGGSTGCDAGCCGGVFF